MDNRIEKPVAEFVNLFNPTVQCEIRRFAPSPNRQTGGYHKFMIFDPKEREIQAITYRDRIVQHTLCDNFFMPLLERKLIFSNVACRKKKGGGLARSLMRKYIRKHYRKKGLTGYFVKADVAKFFNTVDHDVLKKLIRYNVGDTKIIRLLDMIVDSYCHSGNKGLPLGNQTSQCFGLLYLNCLDRGIKECLRVKNYIRYMDDMLILVPSKQQATECLREVNNYLKTVRLNINTKSQVVSFRNGIEFLGWRYTPMSNGRLVQKLKRATKKRIETKLKFVLGKNSQCVVASYRGFLSQGNEYMFEKKIESIVEKRISNLQTLSGASAQLK